ncbi:unnamed protein product [Mytilus coruscus]|uniref:Uncharacterized protein n=1 Tax=Mytilus coruscus TaxID=42192 RepID=A0A6J8BPG0_MYTCO|nr:unnamed protein product [Mytilus coruscus]
MATGDNLSLCCNWQTFYSFDNCRYAIMNRYITGNYCEILPDGTISDTLADHVPYLGEACSCCVCRRYSIIIVAASSCVNDLTDYLIMSMRGSDKSESVKDVTTYDLTCDMTLGNNPENLVCSCSDEIGLPKESETSVVSHSFSDDETQMPPFSRTDMYLPVKSFLSFEFDDFDSQLLFEPEGADGISLSDAETQYPTNFKHVHASAELINPTISKTEIEIPSEVQETFIFIGLKRKQNDEFSDSESYWFFSF